MVIPLALTPPAIRDGQIPLISPREGPVHWWRRPKPSRIELLWGFYHAISQRLHDIATTLTIPRGGGGGGGNCLGSTNFRLAPAVAPNERADDSM